MRSTMLLSLASTVVGGLAGISLTVIPAQAFTIAYRFTLTGQVYDYIDQELVNLGQMGSGTLQFDGSGLTGEGLETLTPTQNKLTFTMTHDLVPETITESSEHYNHWLDDIGFDHPYVRVSNPQVQYREGVFQGLYFFLDRGIFEPGIGIYGRNWRTSSELDPRGLSTVGGSIHYTPIPTPVPEPASILGVLSLAGVGLWKHRQLKASSPEK